MLRFAVEVSYSSTEYWLGSKKNNPFCWNSVNFSLERNDPDLFLDNCSAFFRTSTSEQASDFEPELFRGQAVDEEAERCVESEWEAWHELEDQGPERGVVALKLVPPVCVARAQVDAGHVVKLEDVEDGARGVAHEEDEDDGKQDPAMGVIFSGIGSSHFCFILSYHYLTTTIRQGMHPSHNDELSTLGLDPWCR